MSLAIIGIGLTDEKDISIKGFEHCKAADRIYLENYTSRLQVPMQRLESSYGKKIIFVNRELVEQRAEQTILHDAAEMNVCFLVIGDAFSATTHIDLYSRARLKGIEVCVVHNASIMSAIGITGLQVYKFGKTISIPFNHDKVSTPYHYLEQNKSIGAHTLFLLDLDPIAGTYLSILEAIAYLEKQESMHHKKLIVPEQRYVACARIGSDDAVIAYGTRRELESIDFGSAPYCLIVTGTLHFAEEEMLEAWQIK